MLQRETGMRVDKEHVYYYLCFAVHYVNKSVITKQHGLESDRHQIETPTMSIDVHLLEERPCQN